MTFKAIGITWDFRSFLSMLWVFIGMVLILATFAIPAMSIWVFICWLLSVALYMASADSIIQKIKEDE